MSKKGDAQVSSNMARTREHIIETQTRRIVPSLLPAERFVERDQTERDYGIDLVVECFDDGEPTGAYLLFQLKGTDVAPPEQNTKSISFDAKVKHLRRAERFVTPIILVWCPVQAEPQRFWFLWLQDYIRVVLNNSKPKWREQGTIRLFIPNDNVVSSADEFALARLRHIANHPRRLEQFGQLARLTHAAPFVWNDPAKLAPLFKEVLKLDAIFGDRNWTWSNYQRGVVEKGLRACEIALQGIDPTDDQLRETGWLLSDDTEGTRASGPPRACDLNGEDRWSYLEYGAKHCARLLLNMVAVYFDDPLRHTLWLDVEDHDF